MSEHAQILETFADLRRRLPDPDTAGSDAALIAALDAGAAALRRLTPLRSLADQWRDSAAWEHDEMANRERANALDQCADQLMVLCGQLPAPPEAG